MLHALIPFAVGFIEILVLWGVIALAVRAVGLVRKWWWAWRERGRVAYECYAAEQFIRETRRRAIHDMLETAHTYRDTYDADATPGTAVEVRRP